MENRQKYPLGNSEELCRVLEGAGEYGLGVDIDETLSYTVYKWFELLRVRFGAPGNMSTVDIIKTYRYAQHVPGWDKPEVGVFIEEFLTSNDFQRDIPIMKGAKEGLQKVASKNRIAAYITARPEVVYEGTCDWLGEHDFPPAMIIMRPPHIPFEERNTWKAGELVKLLPFVWGIVEDNHGLIDALPPDYPGHILLFDHPGHSREGIRITLCPDWEMLPDVVCALSPKNQ